MNLQQSNEALLTDLQHKSFSYFLKYVNRENGLIRDNSAPDAPASVTATGLALAAYPIAVERGILTRADALGRTLTTLRFFWHSHQGPEPDATGYQGFFYHFLQPDSGRRHSDGELSSIETTFLVAGALTAAAYFDGDTEEEHQVRELADALYRRVRWDWFLSDDRRVHMGWQPEKGFSQSSWKGYSEASILYVLGLGSPTHPLPADSYDAWCQTYEWRTMYDYGFLYAGPLFIHQLSHLWIDFRGIQDAYMRAKYIDYFQNSRRATYAQQKYAEANPQDFEEYGKYAWGITASPGPGPATRTIDGREIEFYDYKARGIPTPDDGTLSPWASITSLPFAPEIVIPTIRRMEKQHHEISGEMGFLSSFNPTFTDDGRGWTSDRHYGLNQGPIIVMIENYFSGMIWKLMRRCPYIISGLQRAGFTGGWLSGTRSKHEQA